VTPPVACKVCEYAVPTVPLGRLEVVIARAAGLMVILSIAVAVCGVLSESATWTVKLEVAALVGVPEIVPVLAPRESPAGRLPELMFHV